MDDINRKHAIFVNWIPPLIEALKEKGGSATPKEVREFIAKKMKLSDSLLSERHEKSGQLRFDNQVYWAKQYLAWEGYVETSKHGIWSLTDSGRKVSLGYSDALALVKKWVEIHRDTRKKRVAETKPAIAELDMATEEEIEKSLSLLEIHMLSNVLYQIETKK